MDNFKWTGAFNIGITEMDEEHRNLLARMSKFEVLNKSLAQKHTLLSEFKSFILFTTEHFQHEENLMQEYEYPSLLEHISIHRDLISKLNKYMNELERSVYSEIPSSVFDFFNNWLVSHILIIDRRYAEFIHAKKTKVLQESQ